MINPAIIEQLEYLIEEVEMLRGIIKVYPDAVLGQRSPTGEPSIKELFGALIEKDRELDASLRDATVEESEPPDWSSVTMDQLLADLANERRSLVSRIRDLPVDRGQLESALHSLVTDGGDQLRTIAYRLHEMPIGQFLTATEPAPRPA